LQERQFFTHVEAMGGQMRSNIGIACHQMRSTATLLTRHCSQQLPE
jgi:hypothetical protein